MYLGSLAGPQFYDGSGRPISSILCGQPYTMDVPGYAGQVWLDQTKNGNPNYSGKFSVPMSSYTANCMTETGVYQNTLYALNPDGSRGALLGSTTFEVRPIPVTAPTVTPAPAPVPATPMYAPPVFQQIPAPAYQPGGGYTPSGARITSSGIVTPSPTIVTVPGQPPVIEPPAPAPDLVGAPPQSADWLPWAIVGLGVLIVLGRRSSGRSS